MTTKRYTGQYHEESLGLYFYGARWYDPLLGRFTQADTLIPDPAAPQAFNRYAYTLNNPLRYVDPSGHRIVEPPSGGGGRKTAQSPPLPLPPLPPIHPIKLLKRILWDDFLATPYIKPLWKNPQIGLPVMYADYRKTQGDAPEALLLTSDWYWERGNDLRIITGDSEIIQYLVTSKALQEARKEFRERGGKDMIGIGKGAYEYKFDVEYFTETPKAIFHDDWSSSFLGGFHVEFRNQERLKDGGRVVEITVINDTGWASGTRIPFTHKHVRDNEPRFLPGPGGTLWQYYTWREVFYFDN